MNRLDRGRGIGADLIRSRSVSTSAVCVKDWSEDSLVAIDKELEGFG